MMFYAEALFNNYKTNQEGLRKDVENTTPSEYYHMSSMERLEFHLKLGNLKFIDDTFDELGFLRSVGNDEVVYKYRLIESGIERLFKNAAELRDYTGMVVQKINMEISKGNYDGVLAKINETHVYDRLGNTLDIRIGKVYM